MGTSSNHLLGLISPESAFAASNFPVTHTHLGVQGMGQLVNHERAHIITANDVERLMAERRQATKGGPE